MCTNIILTHGDQTPGQGLYGLHPRDYCDTESDKLDSFNSAIDVSPDTFESAVRLQYIAKQNIWQTVIEECVARAHNTEAEMYPAHY